MNKKEMRHLIIASMLSAPAYLIVPNKPISTIQNVILGHFLLGKTVQSKFYKALVISKIETDLDPKDDKMYTINIYYDKRVNPGKIYFEHDTVANDINALLTGVAKLDFSESGMQGGGNITQTGNTNYSNFDITWLLKL